MHSDAMLAAAIITSPLGSIPVEKLPTYAEQIAAYKLAREEAKRAKAATAGTISGNSSNTSDDATITTPLHDGNSTSIEVSDVSAVTVYPVAVATSIPATSSTAPSPSSSSSRIIGGSSRGAYAQIV